MPQFPSLSLIDNISLVSVWEFNVVSRRWRLVSITRPPQAIAMSKGTGRLVFPTSVSCYMLSKLCPTIDLLGIEKLPIGNKDKILAFIKTNPGQTADLIAEYLKIEPTIVVRCLQLLERRSKIYYCRSIKSSKKQYYYALAANQQATAATTNTPQNFTYY